MGIAKLRKLKVQSRASETLQDQIIEEIEEMEQKTTEEALELVSEGNGLWINTKTRKKKRKDCRTPAN